MDEAVRQRKAQRRARKQKMLEMYLQNNTLQQIGERFGISRQRVQQILIELGCERRPAVPQKKNKKTPNSEKKKKKAKKRLKILSEKILREMFENRNLSTEQIRRELNVRRIVVKNSLDYYGIRFRTQKQIIKLIRQSGKLTEDELYTHFVILKLSANEIAERFDVYPKPSKQDILLKSR